MHRNLLHRAAPLALLCLAAGPASAQWYEEDEPRGPSGPRGPYVSAHVGLHDPTGPTLGGFDRGLGLAGAVGYRFGPRAGLELAFRRVTTERDAAEVTQDAYVPSLRIHGSLGPVKTDGALGLGWFKTRATGMSGDGSGEVTAPGRLGFLVNLNLALPLPGGLDVLAGVTYAGANATLERDPVWIAGLTYEAGLRFTLPVGGAD